MSRVILLTMVLAFAALFAGAQPDPNQPANPQPVFPRRPILQLNNFVAPNANNAAMELTPKGLFVVADGMLVKFDPQTLAQQGPAVKLIEDAPFPAMGQGMMLNQNVAVQAIMVPREDVVVVEDHPFQVNPPADPNQPNPPNEQKDAQAMQRWQHAMQLRAATPAIVKNDTSLIVIIGDTFTRVNQQTMEVEAKTSLADPANPNPAPINPGAPALKLAGGTLYLLNNPKLLAVDIATGKVLTRGTMPPPAAANMPPAPLPPVDNAGDANQAVRVIVPLPPVRQD